MILAVSVVERAKASFGLKTYGDDDLVMLMGAELLNARDRRRHQFTAYEADGINYIPAGFWDSVYEAVQ